MYGGLACAALVACALAVASPAQARPFTELSSLRPVNKQGQLLQRVVRGREATLLFGFRVASAPRTARLRVRVSYRLVLRDDVMRAVSMRAPVVWTGAYRFRMPIEVPKQFAAGRYRLRGLVEVLNGNKKVVARDALVRGLRVR